LRRLDDYIGELDNELGLLPRVSMLQPLSLPAIERLARGLKPVHVSPARRYFARMIRTTASYVVESGAAEVVGDDDLITTLGPGGDCAATEGAAYGHGACGQSPRVAGTDLRPFLASRYRISAEPAGGGG
jgi:hypothetical protein